MSESTSELTVHDVTEDGRDVVLLDLRAADGSELPPFTAGAHIDIHTGNGLIRQYSLCNSSQERYRYLVAVALARPSRGGSEWIHQQLKTGSRVTIGGPRNHFALDNTATHSVLVAGGIGITPILAMAMELEAQGKRWEIHFSARNRDEAALLKMTEDFVRHSAHGSLHLYLTRSEGGQRLNFAELFAGATADSHFYCCGSNAFLDDYIAAGKVFPAAQVHYERFSSDQEAATGNEYTLVLARSGKEVTVHQGETVLDALTAAGVRVSYMCSEGVCGSCEVRVLEGTPDHRDSVLSDAEKAQNNTMMVCCSGSLSDRLVLDL
ncbi:MAG: PDR/VanB family oxidoreductase [Pseudomonadota bacterium]|nr:PDR/VanB family oxidoreductase [Pseudomonadota bacterium]